MLLIDKHECLLLLQLLFCLLLCSWPDPFAQLR